MEELIDAWNSIGTVKDLSTWATIGMAIAMGALIGAERERRYRMAGLRTNALVCVVAAIFVHTAKGWQADGAVHNQAYVITGAAWVAGALLFKDGHAVKGLDSAITIWGAAAVGCAIGGGSLQAALVYTLGLLLNNTLLRWAAMHINGNGNGNGHERRSSDTPPAPAAEDSATAKLPDLRPSTEPVPVPLPAVVSGELMMKILSLYTNAFVRPPLGLPTGRRPQEDLCALENQECLQDIPLELATRVLETFERSANRRIAMSRTPAPSSNDTSRT